MFDFLTKMRIGSVVIFQDFFYHWSATLIAVVGILLEKKHLEITETAASALACKVIKPLEMQDAVKIDLLMNKETEIVNYINIAFAECRKIEDTKFDRQDQFLPRITLAKCQWLLENGDSEGGNIWHTMLNTREGLMSDMDEMSEYNFSIRENYELDYKT